MPAARGYMLASDGDVVLKMTRSDYEMLLLALGYTSGAAPKEKLNDWLALTNRIAAGSRTFTAYDVMSTDEKPIDTGDGGGKSR